MNDLRARLQDDLKDRYLIGPCLGRGASAAVFEARDLRHRRSVAIKVLDAEVGSAPREEKFRREIEIVAGLTHPHILPLHDSGVAGGLLYFVMPHIRGRTLRDRLEQVGPLPAAEALRIASEIASALDYAHQRGIVHRDIKPGNVLIESGHALVADFGLARFATEAPEEGSAGTPASPSTTATGTIVGTPLYMSPEQATADPIDGRSDLYALGCVLYEMIVGAPPFAGGSVTEILQAHQESPPPGLRTVHPEVGEGVERAVRRALSKAPEHRHRDAAEFLADLRRLSAEPRRPRWHWPAVGLSIMVILAWWVSTRPWVPRTGPRPADIQSVAILPFRTASAAPEDRYFAEDQADEIARVLDRLPGISVIARSSTAAEASRELSPRRVGLELGADGLVEGSVERVGSNMRVSVQLRHAPMDTVVWSRRFERRSREWQELQFQVARGLAEAIRGRVPPGVRTPRRIDAAAQEAYHRGRDHWNRRTGPELRLAMADFRAAVTLDSTFALAWVGLADSYGLLPQYEVVDVDDVMRRAQDAARRAVDMDTTLAEAYASLGNIEKSWTFDWAAAESLYRKAILLDPNYSTARHWHAVLRVWRGDVQGGLSEIERASQLDPRSPVIRLTLARISYLLRNYPRAIREYQYTLGLDDRRSSAWRGLSDAYFHQGRTREASSAWERSLGTAPESLGLHPGPTLASRDAYLLRRLATGRRLARAGVISSTELAAAYANLGRKDEAFALLGRARMDELVYGDLRTLPDYDALRLDPRFTALEQQVRRRQL